MTVDLTKAPHPDQEPEAGPPAVEKTPDRLTAREELMLPLRAFTAAVAAGSPLLAHWIAIRAWQGLRAASRTQNTPAPAKAAPAPKAEESADSTDTEEDEAAAPAAPAPKPAPRGSFGDLIEQLVMGAFIAGLTCALLVGAITAVWIYLAPYTGWIVLALVVGWCLAATAFAPEEDDATENDHDEPAGEQPQEAAAPTPATGEQHPQEDPWPAVQERLRLFVEQRTAATAAGHIEGIKGRGALVDALLSEQQKHGGLPGMQRNGMIALLEEVGIPVRTQMKFRLLEDTPNGPKWVERNRPGVHVEDLAKHLGRAPRVPAHLVPDITPGSPPVLGEESAPETIRIPASRGPAE